ncbi:hypothetical protein [Vibrio phage S4-7]|nr:hypothetical protein [Vibrio phage S4-7]
MTYKTLYIKQNGINYTVEADITYNPVVCDDKHLAMSDWDTQEEFYIEDILVLDPNGVDVTELVFISDESIKRELDMDLNDCYVDTKELSFFYVPEEKL